MLAKFIFFSVCLLVIPILVTFYLLNGESRSTDDEETASFSSLLHSTLARRGTPNTSLMPSQGSSARSGGLSQSIRANGRLCKGGWAS